MPRPLEPGQKLAFHLDADKAENKPIIYVRAQTAADHGPFSKRISEVAELSAETEVAELVKSLAPFVVGWENLQDGSGCGVPFDIEKLPTLLDYHELWNLCGFIRRNGRVSPEDKKKSES